jgi:hypothetical protein
VKPCEILAFLFQVSLDVVHTCHKWSHADTEIWVLGLLFVNSNVPWSRV